ncbi:hypothetical protein QYS49_34235 [Marivirga salinae]|uniref:Uncharacterized protein n=1 Tax=Marivirga salinarum TaxID=3059078 RepID=A0AA51NCK2_9BACT|nr:hypothetical protein [Marivirga sp. BDSF4-3]WMN12658.1 hypothetical protein QYS49_34235 [Marivirga sp. BDSF4-3]
MLSFLLINKHLFLTTIETKENKRIFAIAKIFVIEIISARVTSIHHHLEDGDT